MKHSKISNYRIERILSIFFKDFTATQAAAWVGLNRKTVNRYFNIFRRAILEWQKKEIEQFSGEIEIDESYFGARRVRGKRGRGAAGKTPVFGVLKRGGKVYITVVPNCSREALMPVITGKILEGSTIYSDGWTAYDGIILNGYEHHRVYHSHNEFARGKNHINGIESFWAFAKRRLAKFNGISPNTFALHLAECQFRFNNRDVLSFSRNLRKSLNLLV